MFFSPVWVRGYAPETTFFCLQRFICLFCPKIGLFIYGKVYFYATFFTFLRPLHECAKVSENFLMSFHSFPEERPIKN
ncbi:hypothetical protein BREVNS_0924 [Brevinematales bacterium NS]|nr:hypothetical protein BREVNS_0924 [Brevinematales bacterium NS]